jgi:hypothetical protein
VPAALYGSVHIGMHATVVAGEPVGGAHSATIEVIDPLIDARSGTFGIRLLLPNPQHENPAALRCQIEFPVVSGSTEKQAPMHCPIPEGLCNKASGTCFPNDCAAV